ncbi:MAG: diguanylate cyclase [Actinomycetales bacterium]|nr:diguanylate cyclase [Actinomycetales bacterium]
MASEQMSVPRLLGLNLVVAVAYAVLGILSLTIAEVGVSAPFWPAAGMAFAVAYRWRWRLLPGVFLGSVATNAVTLYGAGVQSWIPVVAAVSVAAGATLQAAAGGRATHRYLGARSPLETPRDVLLFLLLSGPVSALIASTVGTVTQVSTGILSAGQAPAAWLVWWVGDALGIIVVGPLTLMLLPDQRRIWDGRRWTIAVPSLIAAVLLVGSVVASGSIDAQRLATERRHMAEDAQSTLLAQLGRQQEVLEGIKGLELASDVVTAEEFRVFTAPALVRFPAIQAVSYNPVVQAEDLAGFIAAQRAQPDRADFTVTERDADGNLVPVGSRRSYVVVQYIEPLAANAAALGFDIASNAARLEAITRATDTAAPSATAPVDLVQETGTQKGVLVLTPVFEQGQPPSDAASRRDQIQGFAVGVYRLSDLPDEVFDGSKWDDLTLRLTDVTAGAEPTVLGERVALSDPTVDLASGEPDPIDIGTMKVFGRTWALEVIPVAGALASGPSESSPIVLIGALVGVYLFEALLILLTGLERRSRREALQKSYEATHDELTGVTNRRGFIDRLTALCDRAEADQATHVLLFADLDRFKRVNDQAGHEVGDQMLVAVAEALRRNVRGGDTVARVGGDEFAVILSDCPLPVGERTAHAVIESVDAIRIESPAGEMGVGISVGLTPFGFGRLSDPDDVLRRADVASYVAKRAPGSRVHVAEGTEKRGVAPDLQ